jgi:hypothetical protein
VTFNTAYAYASLTCRAASSDEINSSVEVFGDVAGAIALSSAAAAAFFLHRLHFAIEDQTEGLSEPDH